MASSSKSSVKKSFRYDVFLSFRGEDTRNGFVGHLYQAFKHKGIETYKDDEKIEKGKTIDDQLIKSIEDSRFYIIVFSKNYASSSWCLDELVKIMECQETPEQTAYPIFFDVEPTEVRKQSGAVKEAFAQHEKKEVAGKWKEAMREASNLAGWELKATTNRDESKLIQIVVDGIFRKLCSISLSIDGNLVGIDMRKREVLSSLDIGAKDVRIIGIKGMGGGGKTTLARAVYDQISNHFEGKSFVANVREVSKASLSGLKKLQKQILRDVLNDRKISFNSVSDGKNTMIHMMCRKKVLVVLDDVDRCDQLEALVGDLDYFKSGSRIIITTRDEQVLVSYGVSLICNVKLLTDNEAVCLFSRYAFGNKIPTQGYNELSGQVVRYAAGLPLTIKVLGSFLRGKNELEWKDALERLKKIPHQDTLKMLEISYDALEPDHKDIFLDVACILKGEQKDKAIRVLESCGFHASIGLSVLEKKSLISISKYGSLGMHDRIEEMGKYIDCHLHPDEHNRHSRLWIDKEIEDILGNNLINEAIRCIKLSPQRLDLRAFMTGIRNMKKVRVLYMCSGSYWDDARVSQLFPNSLRYLCWRAYPFTSLHETFQADNLVGLDMSFSSILQLWLVGKGKALTKLRFLDLSYTGLGRLNLRLTPNLERLDLKNCWNLVEINAPVGCLKNLLYMDLSGCGRFRSFLFDKQTKSLKAGSLPELDLTVESVDKCALHPDNNFPKYRFTCVYKEDQAASSFGNLEKLISLGLCACTNFESFSSSICSLQYLRKLTLEGGIMEVPKDLHHLLHLEELYLSKTKIKYLPDGICMLKQLKYINLEDCHNLEKLPEDFGKLESLEELILSNSKIKYLPDSVCMLKQLKALKLQGCKHFERLPESFGQLEYQEKVGRLECLQELDLTGTAISKLPQCILRLKGVRITGSKMMLESFGFTSEIQSSHNKTFVDITCGPKKESPVPSMASTSSTSSIRKLYSTNLIVDGKLVGMETRISDVLSYLDIGNQDVRMVGIKGMGGCGKTTLATVVYDQISNNFEGKIFIKNVREVSKSFGLEILQKKILNDVLDIQDTTFSSVREGRDMLIAAMRRKKILVVLDDVDHIEQLEALAGEPDWFESGSRIIITTRDEQVLVAHKVHLILDVNLLSDKEAICLFSRYAFGRENPSQGDEELSRNVVRYAAGLPLTVKVLGSFLCGKDRLQWVDAIDRLKRIPLKETLEKLELSYISLEDDYKEIFLDIACMLKGKRKEDAIRILESCGFHARNGLEVLEHRSLIIISPGEYGELVLSMHDHIEEMGKNIVRRLHPDEPNKHSRLWINEEIENILANDVRPGLNVRMIQMLRTCLSREKGTLETKCLSLKSDDLSAETAIKGLANMNDHRFLEIQTTDRHVNWEFDKTSEYLPSSLRFMTWDGFPFSSLPNTFQGKHLVGLEIVESKFVQLWEDEEEKVLNNLRFLKISWSKLKTFDLRLAPNLEQLTIQYCREFIELRIPADHHSKLEYLDLTSSKLTSLHLGNTPNLKTLVLSRIEWAELQMPAESSKLEHLGLSYNSKLKTIHFGSTPNLKTLKLNNCYELVELQMPAESLMLEHLGLSYNSRLKIIHFGSTPNLKTLKFNNCYELVELQMPTESLMLEHLDLSYNSSLKIIHFGSTPNVKTLKFNNCYELVELQMPAESLMLEHLDVSYNSRLKIIHFGSTPNLKTLKFNNCYELVELQMPAESLMLEHLDLSYNTKLKTIHFGSIPNLKTLKLNNCYGWVELQMPAQSLMLEHLDLSYNLKLKTIHFGSTSNLKTLKLYNCYDLVELPMPAESLMLEHLDLSYNTKLKTIHFGSTSNLKTLKLNNCYDLVELPMPAESLKLEHLDLSCNSKLKTIHLGSTPNLESLILKNCNDLVLLPELRHVKCLKELNIESTGVRRHYELHVQSSAPQSFFPYLKPLVKCWKRTCFYLGLQS